MKNFIVPFILFCLITQPTPLFYSMTLSTPLNTNTSQRVVINPDHIDDSDIRTLVLDEIEKKNAGYREGWYYLPLRRSIGGVYLSPLYLFEDSDVPFFVIPDPINEDFSKPIKLAPFHYVDLNNGIIFITRNFLMYYYDDDRTTLDDLEQAKRELEQSLYKIERAQRRDSGLVLGGRTFHRKEFRRRSEIAKKQREATERFDNAFKELGIDIRLFSPDYRLAQNL